MTLRTFYNYPAEALDAALRPVHYREAAASLRKYARPGMHPEYVKGFISAAALLDSVAFDLDEGES